MFIPWRVGHIVHIHSDLKGLERWSLAVSGSKPFPSQAFSTDNDWLVLSFLEKAVVLLDDNIGRNVCLREDKRRPMRVAGKTYKKMTRARKDKPAVGCDGRAESWICGGLKYWTVMNRHRGSPKVVTNFFMESKHRRPVPEKAAACLWSGPESGRVWL